MERIVCALCGKNQVIRELYPATFTTTDLNKHIYSARRLPDRIHYRVVKCSRCGLIFSNPILPPKTIAGLYRASVCTYDEVIDYTTHTYGKLFADVQKYLPRNPKVLEVGCGNGFFLQYLYARGIKRVWGVEPGQAMVSQAPAWLKARIVVDVLKANQFPPASFDLICCFHTLDHMVDPLVFAESSLKLLADGGLVLAVVHDSAGMSVRLFGERSPIFDIEHIYLFNKATLGQLFTQAGFETEATFDVANTYPWWYWWRMAGLPKSVKQLGLALLRATPLGNLPLTAKGGNIGIIARRPGRQIKQK